ncbi:hypothetical protein B4U80_07773 [Leptotrombidium deliense]|uniref:D-beta-hydroxybutyrate dehydrogenase-like protein n=1 Tax=Leptotrombidium deliense TaxID=299467 RepID=A0A443S346_9ACAR|nr:hypothetical protein B4U80_07773 [Leptotrombidium deliense]
MNIICVNKALKQVIQPKPGSGAKELLNSCEKNLRIIKLDVTKDEDVKRSVEEVKCNMGDNELWAIVNNAGILISAEIEMGDIECFTKQMDVNCLGIIRVSKAFIPLLRKASGRVVNMASLAGRFSIPGMVAYCVSKAGVISFSDGLRREMKKWNIDVITVEPHLFKTNLCDQQSQQNALLNAWNESSSDVKQNYGEKYFEGFQLVLEKMLQSARPRVHDVVDTMFTAVTHRFVSSNYTVLGDIERLRVTLWSILPTRLVDFIGNLVYLHYTGKPVALISSSKDKIK